MSRRYHARPRRTVARQLIVEAVVFVGILALIAIALPVWFGAGVTR